MLHQQARLVVLLLAMRIIAVRISMCVVSMSIIVVRVPRVLESLQQNSTVEATAQEWRVSGCIQWRDVIAAASTHVVVITSPHRALCVICVSDKEALVVI